MDLASTASSWNLDAAEDAEDGFGFGGDEEDDELDSVTSPIKVPSGGEDDTPTPDDYNSFIKGSVSQRDIFGGFEEAGDSDSEDVGGFGFIDVPDDLDHDFDDNDVPNEASDESTARVSRPQLDEWEAATGGGSDGVNQPGYSAADIENETTDNSTINTANTADESNAADDVGDATDAEVVLGERNGWCKVKTVKKTMTAKQTRKAPWKDLFLTLTKTGALDMRAMPNDPAPLLSLEIPYGVLLYDPGTERFSLAYRNETYHCDAKTDADAMCWIRNLEKSKKLNRRKSSYGRSARTSTGILF